MNILFLRGFNNYFNRKVKLYSTLNAYRANSSSYVDYSNINFNPNDGVATELVIGGPTQLEGNNILAWDTTGSPDYAVCYENNTIVSRWFVIETNRTRNGQYSVSLKRDTVVDNFNIILAAPCFIKKAKIKNSSNPLIFNREGSTYNQIKKSETLLQDESGCAWVVGYIPSDSFSEDTTIDSVIPYTGSADFVVENISGWEYYNYVSQPYKYHIPDSVELKMLKHRKTVSTISGTVETNRSATFNWKNPLFDNQLSTYTGDRGGIITSPYSTITVTPTDDPDTDINYNRNYKNAAQEYFANAIKNNVPSDAVNPVIITADVTNTINALNNKTILDSTSGKYYRINVHYGNSMPGVEISDGLSKIYNYAIETNVNFKNWFSRWSIIGAYGDYTCPYIPAGGYYTRRVYIELVEQTTSIKTTIYSNRYHLRDQPYDMFCIPYGDGITIKSNETTIVENANKFSALQIATAIGEKTGTGNVYDIQLLPYCPIRQILTDESKILDYGELYVSQITSADGNTKYNTIFWCTSSEFSFDINKSIEIDRALVDNTTLQFNSRVLINTTGKFTSLGNKRYEYYYTIPDSEFIDMGVPQESLETIKIKNITLRSLSLTVGSIIFSASDITLSALKTSEGWQIIIECYSNDILNFNMNIKLTADIKLEYLAEDRTLSLKLSNETDLYRLCSPNWSGYFDFSVAKMGGVCSGFNVDCSYKPFQPYIHVNPKFSGLYGNDFNDARGLICGGDFSLPQLNNAWANYQLNNKNYQAIFDRQMQNLDINNKYQQENDIFGAITGGIGSTVSGAAGGAMVGGIPGAIVGGVLGAAGGTVGGILDVNRNANLRKENKQLQIDLYNYNLGNIKALPTSLTKVSAYNNNNKIFPILEYYTCTPKEKEILKNKIKYDGMTIMEISTLSEYNNGYIKGRLIRLDDLNDDSHVADDIYAEVSRGLYLGG